MDTHWKRERESEGESERTIYETLLKLKGKKIFDTVYHGILFQKLEQTVIIKLGITFIDFIPTKKKTICWIKWYSKKWADSTSWAVAQRCNLSTTFLFSLSNNSFCRL